MWPQGIDHAARCPPQPAQALREARWVQSARRPRFPLCCAPKTTETVHRVTQVLTFARGPSTSIRIDSFTTVLGFRGGASPVVPFNPSTPSLVCPNVGYPTVGPANLACWGENLHGAAWFEVVGPPWAGCSEPAWFRVRCPTPPPKQCFRRRATDQ